ncbi:MAG: 3-phosphoshikimate 1-carboxyvinyltransferase [Acidimicrobiales bacterium]
MPDQPSPHAAAPHPDPAPGPNVGNEVRWIMPLIGPVDAVVTVPGSKSITNRALLVAGLAQGPSLLSGVLDAADTAAMMGCLRPLGITVTHDPHAETVLVNGTGGRLAPGPQRLDAHQSGTTARFLPPVLALGRGPYLLDGDAQLRARPFGPLFGALRRLGTQVDAADGDRLPVSISAGEGPWPGSVDIAGDVSSQFISGLMMVGPLLPGGLRIQLTTPTVSGSYLALTARVMADFGAETRLDTDQIHVVAGGYSATDQLIEADASAASYFFAAAAICGGRVRVDGLGTATTQGDAAFADVLGAMGCTVRRGVDWTEVIGPQPGALQGIEADFSDLSDTAPTLAAVAPFAATPTRLVGIGFIRAKESDRVGAVVHELQGLGVDAVEEPDGFLIRPSTSTLRGGVVQTYDDHRLAMAFSLVGLRVAGVGIANPGCVAKTFPRYWSVFDRLRPAVGS